MPITQPDAWTSPPFEARLVEQAPYKKVLIGRGATNSKGPQMAQLNAFRAIKAVHGKLPVNLIFVAEGDEERMDIGLRKWVKDHPELHRRRRCDVSLRRAVEQRQRRIRRRLGRLRLRGADDERQPSGAAGRPCRTFTAPTSAASTARRGGTSRCSRRWCRTTATRRRSTVSSRHPAADARIQEAELQRRAKSMDMKIAAENLGVARFMSDDPYEMLEDSELRHVVQPRRHLGRQHVSRAAPARSLPNKITSKHNFRYVPNMNGPGHRQEAARAARQERLRGCRGEADRRRAVGEDEFDDSDIGQRAEAHL